MKLSHSSKLENCPVCGMSIYFGLERHHCYPIFEISTEMEELNFSHGSTIRAVDGEEAAKEWVNLNYGDLENPKEIDVYVRERGKTEVLAYTVYAERTIVFSAIQKFGSSSEEK